MEMREGSLDGVSRGSSEGAGLRVLRDGRMGFASAGGLSPQTLRGLCDQALAQIAHLEPDSCKDLPAPAPRLPPR